MDVDWETDALDYWRLCDEVSVIQAALLLVGKDPSGLQAEIFSKVPSERPRGFEAVFAALKNAIEAKRLPATLGQDEDGHSWYFTTISVVDLKAWLKTRGFNTGFFFPATEGGPDYLSKEHENYTPKLAAAIKAWEAVSADEKLRLGKTVKQALVVWLNQHANDFGLTKEDGKPNDQGIEDVAKIANWDTKGGAPKSPGNE